MASDIFLRLKGIEGESTDELHRKEIEILSFSGGVSMAVSPSSTAGSAPSERASLTDLSFTKFTDAASPALFRHACQGQPIGEAVLSVNRADGKGSKVEYLKYTLADVLISSYAAGATANAGLPTESFSLHFRSIRIEYTPTDRASGAGQGAKMAGWDTAANKPI